MSVRLGRRIVLGTIASTAVVVGVAAGTMLVLARAELTHALDRRLRDQVQGWLRPHHSHHAFPGPATMPPPPGSPDAAPPAGVADASPEGAASGPPTEVARLQPWRPEGRSEPWQPEVHAPGPLERDGGSYLAILTADGSTVLARSPSLSATVDLVALLRPVADGAITTAQLPSGPVRLLRLTLASHPPFLPPWLLDAHGLPRAAAPPGPLVVAVATDLRPVLQDMARLARILAALWGIAIALASLAGVMIARMLVQPIHRVSAAIAGIAPTQLDAPLVVDRVPVEMAVILERLQEMKRRLQDAFSRERATIANIAHELRTPITGLSTTLEFALARGPGTDHREDLQACLGMAQGMQRMIANLLLLARLEAGQVQPQWQAVPLTGAVERARAPLAERFAARGLTIAIDVPAPCTIRTEPDLLGVVLGNLLDNAASYAVAGTTVRIHAREEHGRVRLEIENTAEASLTDTHGFFQAFWRGSQARTAGEHCGLGLALVRRIMHVLGGEVEAVLTGPQLTLRCVWPAVPPARTP